MEKDDEDEGLENIEFNNDDDFGPIEVGEGGEDSPHEIVLVKDLKADRHPKLLVRFEVVVQLNKNTKPFFLAPGQLVPVFRQDIDGWKQVVQAIELRTYTIPVFEGNVWVMANKNKPSIEDGAWLAKQPPRREMVLSCPGGRYTVRPHPRIPGAIGMTDYPGPDLGYNLLDRHDLQAGELFRAFGDHPVSNAQRCPLRWVTPAPVPTSAVTFEPQAAADCWGYNPLTEKKVGAVETQLPVGFRLGHEVVESFNPYDYMDSVYRHVCKAKWVYVQNCMEPWGAIADISSARATMIHNRQDLPKGILALPWYTGSPQDPYGEESLTPQIYDQLRRFTGKVYDPHEG